MHGAGLFFFLLFLLLIFAAVGWVGFTQYRARKAGLPPPSFKSYIPFLGDKSRSNAPASNYPSPRAAGPVEWIKDQFAKLSNRRTAQGAYENTGSAQEQGNAFNTSGSRRGRGTEDDAWDTQVRDEDAYGASGPGGYYEEQELGLAPTPGLQSEPYGTGSSYIDARTGYENERGRSANRSPGNVGLQPQPGQQGHSRGLSDTQNPFGDDNEAASLRDVSPRPEPLHTHIKGQASLDSQAGNTSPISTRKSLFREGL